MSRETPAWLRRQVDEFIDSLGPSRTLGQGEGPGGLRSYGSHAWFWDRDDLRYTCTNCDQTILLDQIASRTVTIHDCGETIAKSVMES